MRTLGPEEWPEIFTRGKARYKARTISMYGGQPYDEYVNKDRVNHYDLEAISTDVIFYPTLTRSATPLQVSDDVNKDAAHELDDLVDQRIWTAWEMLPMVFWDNGQRRRHWPS